MQLTQGGKVLAKISNLSSKLLLGYKRDFNDNFVDIQVHTAVIRHKGKGDDSYEYNQIKTNTGRKLGVIFLHPLKFPTTEGDYHAVRQFVH